MEKVKKIISENKFLFVIFIACVSLILVECILLFKGDNKKRQNNTITSNTNPNRLTKNEQDILGINSNSNSNNNGSIGSLVEEKKEQVQQEKKEQKKSKAYKEYEKLTEEEKSKVEVIPRKEDVLYDDKIDDVKNQLDISTDTKLPVKYNLADKIKFNFKNQKQYGLCGAFASTRVLESYLQLHNLGTYNLSEIHFDYMSSELMYGSRPLHMGRDFDSYVEYTNINNGVVDNSLYDYDKDYQKEEYMNFVDSDKLPYVITDYVKFPNMYNENGKFYKSVDEEATEEELQDLRNTIKAHIMKNGAVYATVDGEHTNTFDSHFFCSSDDCVPNHAITIIGWDDNYAIDHFKWLEKQPKHNGAFIAVNSWNEEEEYYYISYEDPVIYRDINGILSVSFDDALDVTALNEKQQRIIKDNFGLYIVTINEKEYLTKAMAKKVTYLDLSEYELTSEELGFLSWFENITMLDLSNNNITDLTFLRNLQNLVVLDISNNNISDLSPISQLNLNSLKADNNNIMTITPLENQKDLYDLSLANNPLTDISALSKLSLDYLSLSNCNLKEFNADNNKKLVSLDLSGNRGINILGNLNVDMLNLSNLGLTDIDFIKNYNTFNIDLSNNDIKSIKPLLNINNVSVIDLSSNINIADLKDLNKIYNKEYAKSETELELDNNDLVSSMINIVKKKMVHANMEDYRHLTLYLKDCNITDITIFNDFYVDTLDLSNNQITSVGDFNNNNVDYLILDDNILDSSYTKLFDMNINSLSLKNCNIKDISNLSDKKGNIYSLDLSDNQITDVSYLKNLDIKVLSLANNKGISGELPIDLEILNVSGCDLQDDSIDFSKYNHLNDLNISNNTNIKSIFLKNNNLDQIYYIYLNDSVLSYDDFIAVIGNREIYQYDFTGTLVINNTSISDNKINLLDYPNLYNIILSQYKSQGEDIKILNGSIPDKYFRSIDIDNLDILPEIFIENGMHIKFQQN